MLLPQWMRGAVSSMADSMLALFALSLGAPAAAVGAIVGAQFIGVTCSVLFVAVAVERAGQRVAGAKLIRKDVLTNNRRGLLVKVERAATVNFVLQ